MNLKCSFDEQKQKKIKFLKERKIIFLKNLVNYCLQNF